MDVRQKKAPVFTEEFTTTHMESLMLLLTLNQLKHGLYGSYVNSQFTSHRKLLTSQLQRPPG